MDVTRKRNAETAVARDQVELLRSVGVPEDKIRETLTAHVTAPLARLDSHQDAGLINGARLVEEEEYSENYEEPEHEEYREESDEGGSAAGDAPGR